MYRRKQALLDVIGHLFKRKGIKIMDLDYIPPDLSPFPMLNVYPYALVVSQKEDPDKYQRKGVTYVVKETVIYFAKIEEKVCAFNDGCVILDPDFHPDESRYYLTSSHSVNILRCFTEDELDALFTYYRDILIN